MNLDQQLVDLIILAGPGFIALKVFYIFRAEPGRSQWEWTVWSVLAGFLLAWPGALFAPYIAATAAVDVTVADFGVRVAVGVLAGVLLGVLWQVTKGSARRQLVRARVRRRILPDAPAGASVR